MDYHFDLFVTFSWTHHIRPLHNWLLGKLATCLSDSCVPCALIAHSNKAFFPCLKMPALFSNPFRWEWSHLNYVFITCCVVAIHNSVYSSTNIVQFTFRPYQIGLQVTFIVTDSPKNRPHKRIHQYFSSTKCFMLR